MKKERINQILQTKKESNDSLYKYALTPPINFIGGDIIEARGNDKNNISILSFGDTTDKKVITMSHLGYIYTYLPKKGSWGENEFDSELNFTELFELGHALKKKYTVWLVSIDIQGNGYNKSFACDMNDEIVNNRMCDDFVLFVFGL